MESGIRCCIVKMRIYNYKHKKNAMGIANLHKKVQLGARTLDFQITRWLMQFFFIIISKMFSTYLACLTTEKYIIWRRECLVD